ncbi:MAG: response regulator receiver modulated metal dependent phosphohydrolase [Hyphomicrobiales bacterium]|nr:response regulator receiver modulated metal dependent phosphohydrolase [Hyphomicrobiales bacterium]
MMSNDRHTVLIVDDSSSILDTVAGLLKPVYNVLAARTGSACLEIARLHPRPDLILLDVLMPEMDGYEVLAKLRAEPATRDIPVIFLTLLVDAADEERALEAGAADFILKPIKPAVLLSRVRNQLDVKRMQDWLRDQNAVLEREVARRMAENERTQQVTIRALAHLADTRDPGLVSILSLRIPFGALWRVRWRNDEHAPQRAVRHVLFPASAVLLGEGEPAGCRLARSLYRHGLFHRRFA